MKTKALAPLARTEKKLKTWTAQLDLDQVSFAQNPEFDNVFFNQIDAWRRMEIAIKHKMDRPSIRRHRKDFATLYYSFRKT